MCGLGKLCLGGIASACAGYLSSSITPCLHKIAALCVNGPFNRLLITGNLHWFVPLRQRQFDQAPRERNAAFAVPLFLCNHGNNTHWRLHYTAQWRSWSFVNTWHFLGITVPVVFVPFPCRTICRSAGTTLAHWSARTWCFSIKWRRPSLRYFFWWFVLVVLFLLLLIDFFCFFSFLLLIDLFDDFLFSFCICCLWMFFLGFCSLFVFVVCGCFFLLFVLYLYLLFVDVFSWFLFFICICYLGFFLLFVLSFCLLLFACTLLLVSVFLLCSLKLLFCFCCCCCYCFV